MGALLEMISGASAAGVRKRLEVFQWVVTCELTVGGRDLPSPVHPKLHPQHIRVCLRCSGGDPELLSDLEI